MAADGLDPAGIYFGTRSGQIFGSSDEGKNWKRLIDGLPPVVCVKTAQMGDARAVRMPKVVERSRSRGVGKARTVSKKRATPRKR
jgi:photosystem II stability/assembly factor-like uncharacterized protein